MSRIESWHGLRQRGLRVRQALAHWGFVQYAMVVVLWVTASTPMMILGYGVASLLLPLELIAAQLMGRVADRTLAGRPVPAAARFVEEIALLTLTIEDDGAYSLFFDDAHLAGAHGLVVTGDVARGPFESELCG